MTGDQSIVGELEDLAKQSAERLRQLVRPKLRSTYNGFLIETQLHLISGGGTVHRDVGESVRQDLLRAMKQQTLEWTSGFVGLVEKRMLTPGVNTANGLIGGHGINGVQAPRGARISGELITVGKSLLQAEDRYFKLLTEIDARLNRIRLVCDVPFDIHALAPTGLHAALMHTVDALRWPSVGHEILLFNFERHCINNLESLYLKVIDGVKEIGRDATQLKYSRPVAPAANPRTRRSRAQWMQPPADETPLDTATIDMLTKLALEANEDGYSDGLLAADLLALLEKRPLPGVKEDRGEMALQRAMLAGHFFNEISADLRVTKDEQKRHALLHMPLLKSAIADSSLFTDASHPLSSLIDDLMTKALQQRLSSDPDHNKIASSLRQVLSTFDLAPDFVRASMAGAEPLEAEQIACFYEQQRTQAALRRERVLEEAKQMVAEEIERSSFGYALPPQGDRFLRKVWAAVLRQRLINYGAVHPSWKEGVDKADELIALLDKRRPEAAPPTQWRVLVESLCDDLIAGGLAVEQSVKVRALLDAAWKAPLEPD